MGSLLVHFTQGPESPTTAALGALVARNAAESGHTVALFFAGDSVQLLREATLASVQGIGTGSLQEHLVACVDAGARIYASGMSAASRGLSQEQVPSNVTFAPPKTLVDLVFECDRTIVY